MIWTASIFDSRTNKNKANLSEVGQREQLIGGLVLGDVLEQV